MGLENLKSIFTEGLEKFKNTDVSSFSSRYAEGSAKSPQKGLLETNNPHELRKLNSLFTEGMDGLASNFETGQPQNRVDTKLFNAPPQPTEFIAKNPTDFSTAGIGLTSYSPLSIPIQPYPITIYGENTPDGVEADTVLAGPYGNRMFLDDNYAGQIPILNTLLRQPPAFISNDLSIKHYESQQFDPRIPKNVGIQINNINTYTGTTFIATNPTDFSEAGIGGGVYTPKQIPFTPAPSTIFDFNPLLPEYYSLDFPGGPYGVTLFPGSSPVLDTLLREPPSFVSNDLLTKHYESENFDPRTPKNIGITITPHEYQGTIHKATNPTDYSTAGANNDLYTPLIGMGNQVDQNDLGKFGLDLGASQGWEALYNKDHTPKPINSDATTPFTPYNYGGNVNRDKLTMKNPSSGESYFMTFSPSRDARISTHPTIVDIFGGPYEPGEPYIVSPIGNEGRKINQGSREYPIHRAESDVERLAKFLSSNAGTQFLIKQNQNLVIKSSVIKINNGNGRPDKLIKTQQRFNAGMSPDVPLLAAGSRLTGYGMPNILYPKNGGIIGTAMELVSNLSFDEAAQTHTSFLSSDGYGVNKNDLGLPDYNIHNTFNAPPGEGGIIDQIGDYLSNLNPFNKTEVKRSSGDKMTLAPMIQGNTLTDPSGGQLKGDAKTTGLNTENQLTFNVESEKEGMPLYFKDLRDNSYIFFRAYIEGLMENLVATWNPINYIGRSNPVYTYQSAERDIGFTLKLFAQTKDELKVIYEKLNRLSSLVYPEYAMDTRLESNRMKPPLCKLRVGELYGKENNELLGFIESLNYTVPEESTWETKKGMRVPKFIIVTVTFRVIHSTVPSMSSNLYGYVGG